ncbi:MAG: AMP-binding protein, partial [Acidimicrobiales bacterium]|nr:AMP-binding protein [Acidimicrobiales bacterium]
ALNGAETIIPEAREDFLAAGEHLNLSPGCAFCAFGMAESTLAVTFPEPGSGMSSIVIDRYRLEHDSVAVTPSQGIDKEWLRRFAKLGTPIPGMEVRIVDTTSGNQVESNHVGEIEIRGTSVTPGYLDPQDDVKAFHDGWLKTGDLGFISDDELVACGRIKDIIQLDGRSIYPEDVERRAAGISGVRAGNVIAFATATRKGEPEIVVVAETRVESAHELSKIRSAIQKDLKSHIGIDLTDVALVSPGSIPKTSSGKLQRSLCMRNYVSELLKPL